MATLVSDDNKVWVNYGPLGAIEPVDYHSGPEPTLVVRQVAHNKQGPWITVISGQLCIRYYKPIVKGTSLLDVETAECYPVTSFISEGETVFWNAVKARWQTTDPTKTCQCGVKFTGGIHSPWCPQWQK